VHRIIAETSHITLRGEQGKDRVDDEDDDGIIVIHHTHLRE
jgi:hypothetical protein